MAWKQASTGYCTLHLNYSTYTNQILKVWTSSCSVLVALLHSLHHGLYTPTRVHSTKSMAPWNG